MLFRSVRIGKTYPAPIVDHARAARAAKAHLDAMKRRLEHREESARVARKHGSRKPPPPRGHRRPPS